MIATFIVGYLIVCLISLLIVAILTRNAPMIEDDPMSEEIY
jgi:hypothetical protein